MLGVNEEGEPVKNTSNKHKENIKILNKGKSLVSSSEIPTGPKPEVLRPPPRSIPEEDKDIIKKDFQKIQKQFYELISYLKIQKKNTNKISKRFNTLKPKLDELHNGDEKRCIYIEIMMTKMTNILL